MFSTKINHNPVPYIFFMVLGLLTIVSGKSQTTWVGDNSSSWNTASNWSPAVVPTSGSSTNIVINSGRYSPVLPSNFVLGTLVINSGGSLDRSSYTLVCASLSGTGTITGSALLTVGSATNATAQFSGVIAGTGGLTKAGTGTFTIAGANTYTGATTIAAGTLKLGNKSALGTGAATTIASSATLELNGYSTSANFNSSGTLANTGLYGSTLTGNLVLVAPTVLNVEKRLYINGVISGSGTLEKKGSNLCYLNGANTYTGNTRITLGRIILGHPTALGDVSGTTFINTNLSALDLNGNTIAENLIDTGAAYLLNNSATPAGVTGTIEMKNSLQIGGTGDATISGIISGTGTVAKNSNSTWTLSGANTYGGNTRVNFGILKMGHPSAFGTNTGSAPTFVNAGATVDFNGMTPITESFVEVAGIFINSSATPVSVSGTFALSAATTFGGTGNITLTGILSNTSAKTGSIVKTGTGTLTMSGTNTFTGGVVINAGTLSVATIGNGGISGPLGAATNAAANLVLGGGQLTYTGATASTDRNITFTNTTVSHINISTAGTTLTVSGTTANTTGGFTKEGPGTLTFSGTNAHIGITYVNGGTLNGGSGVTTVPAGQTVYVALGQTVTIPASTTLTNNGTIQVDGTLNLIGNFVNSGTISGTGTYQFSGTSAQTIPGALTYPSLTMNNTAGLTLGGTTTATGTLTVNTSNSLQLNGYSLTVGSLTGSGNITNSSATCPGAILTVNGSSNSTYSGILSGCTGLTKSGSGTFTLSGTNTYTGVTTVAAGSLSVASIGNGGVAGNLGQATAATSIVLSGGTLSYSGATATTNRTFSLSGSSSAIEVTNAANTLTISGVISSTGSITKIGAGTLLLSGTNTYTGVTTLTAGTLSVSSIGNGGVSGNLGAATNAASNLIFNGGILSYTGADASTDRNFILNNGTSSTINVSANTLSWNGSSTSTSGAILKTGTGTLGWAGTNLYTGLTTVNAGTLKLGSTSALGTTASGTIVSSGAALDLHGQSYTSAEAITISGTGVSSSGALCNSSATPASFGGLITLAAASSIVGEAGTIALTNMGTITGDGFGLTLGGSQGGNLQSILGTNSGTLTKAGTGSWTLSGANTYTGTTTISGGILKLANNSALGSSAGGVTVSSGAALDLMGITYSNTEAITINGTGVSGGGAIMNSDTVTATYPGIITLGSASSIVGGNGSINITSTSAISGSGYGLALGGTQGGNLTSPINTGSGTLTKEGSGSWKLIGNSTYTGATTISAGTLKLGVSSTANSGPLGTSAGATTISSGAVLDFNGFSLTSSSVEPIVPNGTGISGGGAIINSSTTASSFNGTINSTSGTAYSIGGAGQITFSGVISGDKNISKTGSNTVVFSAANTYTGSTLISAGTLSVATIANASASSGTLGNNSSIVLDGGNLLYTGSSATTDRTISLSSGKNSSIEIATNNLTISGVISGAGTLNKTGAGTLTLSGTNTFTGSLAVTAGTLSAGSIGASGASSHVGAGSELILSGGSLTYTGTTANSNRNFTLSSTTISTLSVNTSGAALTLSGIFSGAGSLKITNNANGMLELTGSNTYIGATTLVSGLLKLNSLANGGVNSSIGASSSDASNFELGDGTLLYTGATVSTDRNFSITAGTTPVFSVENSSSTLTINGNCGITTGGLKKTGNGILELTGTNQYNGITTFTAGTLRVPTLTNGGVAGPLGAATNAVDKLVFDGGLLEYTGSTAATDRNFTITNGVQAKIKISDASSNLTWSGASNASTGGLTKLGAGTLTLAGLSTYEGYTYIDEGTVKLGNQKVNTRNGASSTNVNAGPLGKVGSSDDFTMTSGTYVADGATLDYNGYALGTSGYSYSGSSYTNSYLNENVTITGDGVGGLGAIVNSSTTAISSNLSKTYLSGNASIGGVGNYPFVYYAGTATLTKKGSNTVSFNSNSNVTGNIVVNDGVLQCAAVDNVLGDLTGTTTVNSGATLDLNGLTHNVAESLLLNGTGYNGVGALYNGKTTAAAFTGPITLSTSSKIGGVGNLTLSGTIGGTGNLTKIGSKTLTLSATTNNTYSGTTTISGGVLSLSNFANLGSSSSNASNLVLNGGSLTYSGTSATLARSFTVADGTTNIFNTSADATNIITLTGSSTGGGSLTKAGAATLLVQGTLNHTGGTKDSTGTVELANANGDALSDSGPFHFGGGILKTKSGGADETVGSMELSKSSTITFGSSSVAHSLHFADSKNNLFPDGELLSITNWVKGTRNADSSFNTGAAGKIFVGTNSSGLTKQQKGKIRFTINSDIATDKYLTFPDVFVTGTSTLKQFYSLSAEQLSTGELVPAVPRPILDIQGTDGIDTICINQSKTYYYTLYNVGDVDAANVNIVSDNASFVVGTKTGSTSVTGVTTLIDTTISTPGSTITFPVVFTAGSTAGLQTVHLITSSTTARTDNDTLILQVDVTAPPSFSSSTAGGACYNDQFATLTASSTGGSYISWHTSLSPTEGDTAYIGNPFIIDPLTATTTYYAQANLGTCVSQGSRTAVTATLKAPAVAATLSVDNSTVCTSGTVNMSVTIDGGSSPYTLIYSNGTSEIMVPNYVSGTAIPVAVSASTTFSIRSLIDALGCACEDISTNGSASVQVITPVGGTPSADPASICPGNTSLLTLKGYNGNAFQWQESSNGSTGWTNVTGGTNATTAFYTTAALSATKYFRAAVTNSTCPVVYSTAVPITVNASVGGTVSSASICTGTSTALTLTGYSGNGFVWQQSDDGINFEQVNGGSGANSSVYTTPTLYTTKYYRVVVTNGSCTSSSSSIATITVSVPSVAGHIAASDDSVCTGTNSTTLTLSSYTGSIQWQSSSSLSGTYTDISGANSATLALSNLTTSTYYRAVVSSGGCTVAISDPYLINVSASSVAGSISGGGILCSSTSTTTLTLTGATGSIQWQQSTDGGISYENIAGATSATYAATTPSEVTYYQAVVTSGVCSSTTTEPVSVDVTSTSEPTSISGTTTICEGASTTLTTTSSCTNNSSNFTWYADGEGNDAYEQGWVATTSIASSQQVTINNNTGGILNITSTGIDPQLTMSGLGSFYSTTNRYINMRYRVTAGTGGTAEFYLLSNRITTITASYKGSAALITDNAWHTVAIDISTVASGDSITGWRFDPTNNSGVTMDIDYIQLGSGAIVGTGSSITLSPTTTTTYYVNKNGNNISTSFISQLVTVNAKPTPTFATQPVSNACSTTEVSYATQAGKSNYVWTIPGSSGTDYTIVSGGSSYDYTLTLKWLSAGSKTVSINYTQVCTADAATTSNATTVSVSSVGGTATASASAVCTGSTATVSLSGNTGSIQWLNSTNGVNNWTTVSGGSGATTSTYTTPALTATKYYRAVVTNGVCSSDSSSIASITVSATPTTANAGADQTSAATCGLTTVTLAGNTPTSGTGAWSIVSGTGGSIASVSSATSGFSGVAGTTYTLRWTISNSPCSASTDDVVIAFNQAPTTASAGPDQTSAATCGLTTVTLAANTPTIGTGAWSIVSGAGGSLSNASSASSSFSGVAGSTYTLRWTISNAPCTASTDDVVVTFNQNPTTANAGADQSVAYSAGTISTNLAGNTPSVGTGTWSIVSGTGGAIASASDPTSGFTGTALTAYTLRWTISTGACTSSDDVVISSGHIWTGSGGDDLWSNGNNWIPATAPVTGSNIAINLGTPHLDVDFTVGGTLTLGGTGSLTVNPGYTLSIANGGVADFGGKRVTFKSDQTGNGQLGTIAGTLNNASNVTVERFVPQGKRAFRFFASPVTTTTSIRANWMEGATPGVVSGYPYTTASVYNPNPGYGTQITGSGGNTNGFDATQLNNPSLFSFNNSTGAWATVSSTAGSIAVGSAYRILVRGDRSYNMAANGEPAGGATTLRTNGTIAQGELTTGVQLPALNQSADGWSLVGNPYQSVVDMYSNEVVKNNLTNYYYIWDPRQGTRGAYVAYNMSLASGGSNNISSGMTRYVQPGQAFFVQNTTAGNNSLVFREAAKGHASNKTATFGTNSVNFASLSAILYYTDSLAVGRESMDAVRVLFGSNFSNEVDNNDGRKFTNLDETLFIKRGASNLSMELRAKADTATLIPLGITQYRTNRYTLRLQWDQPLNDDTLVAYLKDKYLGKETPISKTGITQIDYLLDGQAGSSASDRFELVFKTTTDYVTPISGPSELCEGSETKLTNPTTGGIWSVADKSVVTITTDGTVKGMAAGTTQISYTILRNGLLKSIKQSITVKAKPAKPTIVRDALGYLVTYNASGYQWYKNDELLTAATNIGYLPTLPGYYKVSTTQNGCNSELSDPYYYTTGVLIDQASGSFVRIFPNPVQTEVKIEFLLKDEKAVQVQVYDMKGNRVLEYKGLQTGARINMMALAAGVYRFRVMNSAGTLLYSNTIIRN